MQVRINEKILVFKEAMSKELPRMLTTFTEMTLICL